MNFRFPVSGFPFSSLENASGYLQAMTSEGSEDRRDPRIAADWKWYAVANASWLKSLLSMAFAHENALPRGAGLQGLARHVVCVEDRGGHRSAGDAAALTGDTSST